MFIDQAKIHVKAGDGGDGCASFHRDRSRRYGKADGGPGGKGGDVIVRADRNVETLLDFHYQQHLAAERGGHGGSNNKTGKSGAGLVLRVPPGTLLVDAAHALILRDLVAPGEEVIVACGGAGGRGNAGRKEAFAGHPGESKEIILELKVIADVGIVGYPNVGKSTFLSKISSARPKIAGYPFTTKEPVLGVVRLFDESSFVVADIPGLIEGAHEGRGLGDRFLRHVERTRVLLHMVDISGFEGRDPVTDYRKINKELAFYSKELASRPQIIALNKTDLLEDAGAAVRAFRAKVRKKSYPVSALTGEGLKQLLAAVGATLRSVKR